MNLRWLLQDLDLWRVFVGSLSCIGTEVNKYFRETVWQVVFCSLKIVVQVKASGPPHVLRLWLG